MAPPKPTSPFYKDLKALDQGIADRWRRATNDDPNRKLSYDMMIIIIGGSLKTQIIDKQKIKVPVLASIGPFTEKQSKAIVLLLDKMEASVDQKLVFQDLLRGMDNRGALFDNKAYKQLHTPQELKRVTDCITMAAVGRITWTSPGTRFTYFPIQYHAVADLVAKERLTYGR